MIIISDLNNLIFTISKNNIEEVLEKWTEIVKKDQEELSVLFDAGDVYKIRYFKLKYRIKELTNQLLQLGNK